jgi:hypothetical protein
MKIRSLVVSYVQTDGQCYLIDSTRTRMRLKITQTTTMHTTAISRQELHRSTVVSGDRYGRVETEHALSLTEVISTAQQYIINLTKFNTSVVQSRMIEGRYGPKWNRIDKFPILYTGCTKNMRKRSLSPGRIRNKNMSLYLLIHYTYWNCLSYKITHRVPEKNMFTRHLSSRPHTRKWRKDKLFIFPFSIKVPK